MDENWKSNQIVIEMGSTSLSDCHSRYSPVEKECLAAVTAVTKLDYFCRAAPEVHIFSDCSTLVNLSRKNFSEFTNTRLLRQMEKISGYNLTFHHLPGSRNGISDYLSRYPHSPPVMEDLPSDPKFICNKSLRTMEVNVETKDPMVTHIASIGEQDPDYCELIDHISGKVKEI